MSNQLIVKRTEIANYLEDGFEWSVYHGNIWQASFKTRKEAEQFVAEYPDLTIKQRKNICHLFQDVVE